MILIVPAVAAPVYFGPRPPPPRGAHILPEREVGPYRVTLAEQLAGPPRTGEGGRPVKDYVLRIAEGYPERIRGAYLHLGDRPDGDDLGEALHGDPYRLHVHLPFAPHGADDALWLTLEEWDGTRRQISWPLAQAMTGTGFSATKDQNVP